jgi:crossover junction endodeoxyribonuclease RusA
LASSVRLARIFMTVYPRTNQNISPVGIPPSSVPTGDGNVRLKIGVEKGYSLFELLIPRRPVSHQTSNRQNLQAWKDYVYGRARTEWTGTPSTEQGIRLTLVYLCDESPADTDNIIKPIQDALIGVVLADDVQVSDVDCHRRFLADRIDITNVPPTLIEGVVSGKECVYIRVSRADLLESYL